MPNPVSKFANSLPRLFFKKASAMGRTMKHAAREILKPYPLIRWDNFILNKVMKYSLTQWDRVHFTALCVCIYIYIYIWAFFNSPHALVWTASYGTSWRVMYSAWWLIVCVASIKCVTWLAQFTTERQAFLRPVVEFSKTSFKHRSIQIKGNFTKLILHLYFKCIMYYAGLLFCSVYCQ